MNDFVHVLLYYLYIHHTYENQRPTANDEQGLVADGDDIVYGRRGLSTAVSGALYYTQTGYISAACSLFEEAHKAIYIDNTFQLPTKRIVYI